MRMSKRAILIGALFIVGVMVVSLYVGYAGFADRFLGICVEDEGMAVEAESAGRTQQEYCGCFAGEAASRISFIDHVFGLGPEENREIGNASARACGAPI